MKYIFIALFSIFKCCLAADPFYIDEDAVFKTDLAQHIDLRDLWVSDRTIELLRRDKISIIDCRPLLRSFPDLEKKTRGAGVFRVTEGTLLVQQIADALISLGFITAGNESQTGMLLVRIITPTYVNSATFGFLVNSAKREKTVAGRIIQIFPSNDPVRFPVLSPTLDPDAKVQPDGELGGGPLPAANRRGK